ncbi:hypothetical protein [Amphiplicatus metriothermophilus]|nr:hypothetical protein [Amphiplicatus metriothermophilus]MBB5519942.1 hypothetical protein [Amphiplicatus metriothermophilus]
MYVELKSGYADNGPAWIARVRFSKSGRRIYFHDKQLQAVKGGGLYGGNYYDIDTGEYYWVSGPKKDQSDRHWAGSGPVAIDEDAREEYYALIGKREGRKT